MRGNWINMLSLASALALYAGCAREHRKSEVSKDTPAKVADSFAVEGKSDFVGDLKDNRATASFAAADRNLIRIKKSSLGKVFQLTPTMVVASNMPITDHLAPKLIAFEEYGDDIGIFEVNFDALYNDLQSNKLLQVMPIQSQDDDSVVFSWRYGMQYVSLDSALIASDFPGTYEGKVSDIEESVIPVTSTIVKSASINNNILTIEQVARLRTNGVSFGIMDLLLGLLAGRPLPVVTEDATVHLNVEITPYVHNDKFASKGSQLNNGIGYFENLTLHKGEAEPHFQAVRWDIGPGKEPVTYAISRSAPPEMVDAIKEGILYWNRVLGFEGLHVEVGADPQSEPADKKVLVHWIEWKDAGFARASLQSDPVTGEIKRGDVYMTSVFGSSSKVGVRKWLRAHPKELKAMRIAPSGFAMNGECLTDYSELLGDWQARLAQMDSDAEMRAARDMVRLVVAHEVGHTMGLRHNFAGSTEGEIASGEALENSIQDYLQNPEQGGMVASNSVMDYVGGLPGAMLGAKIKQQVLNYDKVAIDWGYNNAALPKAGEGPAFCTDTGMGNNVDCKVFDLGRSPLDYPIRQVKWRRQNLVSQFEESMLEMLFPQDPADAISVAEMVRLAASADLKIIAQNLTADLGNIAASLQKEKTFLTIDKLFAGVTRSWYNQAEYDAATTQFQRDNLARVGGLAGILAAAVPVDQNYQVSKGWLKAQALAYMERPEFSKGTTVQGVRYELTAEQMDKTRVLFSKLSDGLEEEYVQAVLQQLFPRRDSKSADLNINLGSILAGGDSNFAYNSDLDLGSSSPALGGFARGLILGSAGTLNFQVGDRQVSLPKNLFSQESRGAALGVYEPKNFGSPDWMASDRAALVAEIEARLRLVTNDQTTGAEAFKTKGKGLSLSPEVRAWFDGDVAVLKGLESMANKD